MLASIQFDYKFFARRAKIHNGISNRMLSSETNARELVIS